MMWVLIRVKNTVFETLGATGMVMDTMFDPAEPPATLSFGWHKQQQHASTVWAIAKRILEWAKDCSEENQFEAGWNDRVHSRILDLALDGEGYQNTVGSCNMYDLLSPVEMC